jgi:predicted phosphoribosyltransferase
MPFRDRREAGRRLGATCARFAPEQPVVLGLPRGGVPVAAEVAGALDAPLDVVLVRKLGVPSQPELAMGAIGERGVRVLNDHVLRAAAVTPEQLAAVEARERAELERRARRYRGDRGAIALEGRVAIVVDDGLATGSTARAAIEAVRALGASRVILAVPVAPPDTLRALADVADDVVAVETPSHLWAIGAWYDDFSQTSDDEVVQELAASRPS